MENSTLKSCLISYVINLPIIKEQICFSLTLYIKCECTNTKLKSWDTFIVCLKVEKEIAIFFCLRRKIEHDLHMGRTTLNEKWFFFYFAISEMKLNLKQSKNSQVDTQNFSKCNNKMLQSILLLLSPQSIGIKKQFCFCVMQSFETI